MRLRLLLLLVGLLANAGEQVRHSFSVDLYSLGWERPESMKRHGREIDADVDPAAVSFDVDNNVFVSFTKKVSSGLVTRDRPAFELRVTKFHPDGTVSAMFRIPTNNWGRNGIFVVSGKYLLTRANDELQLVPNVTGANGTTTGNPPADPIAIAKCADDCVVSESPTSRTLVLASRSHGIDAVIDSKAELSRTCLNAGRAYPTSAITDDSAFFVDSHFRKGTLVQEYELVRWPLCNFNAAERIPIPAGGRVAALNDTLFVVGYRSTVYVVDSVGSVKHSIPLGKQEVVHSVRSSTVARRFAIAVSTHRGGNAAFDISSHQTGLRIEIIDYGKSWQSKAIDLDPNTRVLDYALNADGSRVAILTDNRLQVLPVN